MTWWKCQRSLDWPTSSLCADIRPGTHRKNFLHAQFFDDLAVLRRTPTCFSLLLIYTELTQLIRLTPAYLPNFSYVVIRCLNRQSVAVPLEKEFCGRREIYWFPLSRRLLTLQTIVQRYLRDDMWSRYDTTLVCWVMTCRNQIGRSP